MEAQAAQLDLLDSHSPRTAVTIWSLDPTSTRCSLPAARCPLLSLHTLKSHITSTFVVATFTIRPS